MKQYLKILLFYFIIALPLQSAPQFIRFATLAPEGSTWMKVIHELDAEFQNAGGGEVAFKFYPNMVMGDEKDVLRKMRLGQINAAGFTGRGLGEILPEVRILELPYLFQDEAELDFVLDSLFSYFYTALEEKGFILLGWAEVGWVYFFANQPVVCPEDLKNTKPWMWQGDPLAEAFFKELGKTPSPLPITDVNIALQTGMIDAVYCSPLAALALQWFTQVEYISDVPFTNAIGAVLMEKSSFEKLNPILQESLVKLSKEKLKLLNQLSRQDNRQAFNLLLKEGLKPAVSNLEQREQMRKIGDLVQMKLKGQLYSPELLDQLKSIIQHYRKHTTSIQP